MLAFILAGALLATPKPGINKAAKANSFPAGDVREFCKENGVLKVEKSDIREGGIVFSFKENKQRSQMLKSKQVVLVQTNGAQDELLVEEGGKYRRIVSSHSKIQFLAESPDGKSLAVVVVHELETDFGRPPSSALYIFNTTTWIGEQAIKSFGFSDISWSADSAMLAIGDYSKLRVFAVPGYKQIEMCGIDSMVTPDGHERLNDIGWIDAKTIGFGYQNANGKQDYVVRLP